MTKVCPSGRQPYDTRRKALHAASKRRWETRWPLTMALLESWCLAGAEWNRNDDVFARLDRATKRWLDHLSKPPKRLQ